MPVIERNTLHCSFCQKSQHEVKKLIAGPAAHICDECTILCLDILVEENFYDAKKLSREQQVLQREQRMNDLIALLDIALGKELPAGPYAQVKKKVHEFKLLHGPPQTTKSSQ